MSYKIPLSKPWLTDLESLSVKNSIDSGWLTQNGSEITKMENSLREHLISDRFITDRDVTTSSNGTTALHLALLAIGINAGDEIIVPDFCYAAVYNAVIYCNATPVLVDVDIETWNVSIPKVLDAVTDKTKAVIVVDNYGRVADYVSLRAGLRTDIIIIQDACESFPGINFEKNLCGQGDISTFSFYANKIITSGEGGAILGPVAVIEKIRIIKNQGVEKAGTFTHTQLGFNYRLSNMHAALFNAQWSRKREILEKRLEVFLTYKEFLGKSKSSIIGNFEDNPWQLTCRLIDYKFTYEMLKEKLLEKGIETRPGFTPGSKTAHVTEKSVLNSCENSQVLSKEILCLPTFPELTRNQIKFVSQELLNLLNPN